MRCHVLRLTMSAFVVLVALPPSPATAQFQITVESLQADRATVLVDAPPPDYGACPLLECRRAICYASVSPCPPGEPCDGGTSSSFVIITPKQMTLLYGTSYTFTGEWIAERGPRVNNTCTFTCTHVDPVEATTYDLLARGDGLVTLTPIEVAGPNVWVDVKLEPDYLDVCNGNCPKIDVWVTVTPCPAGARYYPPNQSEPEPLNVNCIGGASTFTFFWNPTNDPPLDILFAPGDYYVSGKSVSVFFIRDITGDPCAVNDCRLEALYGPTAFNPSTLPVTSTTWGRVKAMYRE